MGHVCRKFANLTKFAKILQIFSLNMPKPSRKYDHPQEYHRHEGGDSGKLFHSTGKWGVILILFSAVATSIAIFTPYWLQNDYEPTFSKMGLWIRCAGAEDYYRTNFYKFDLTGECRWILVPKEYPCKLRWKSSF